MARPDVRQAKWRRLPLLSELYVGRKTGRPYRRSAVDQYLELRNHAGDAAAARGRPWRRGRHLLPLLYHNSPPRAGHRKPDTSWQNGAAAASRSGTLDVSVKVTCPIAPSTQQDGQR